MSSTPHLRLIVIEDDWPVARAISRTLKNQGHAVEVAHSCAEARGKAGRYDLGVFDIDLPDGTGIDLAREFIKSGSVLLTVFFSATRDTNLQEQAQELGTFVHKSAGVSELGAAVAQTVDASIQSAIAAGAEDLDMSSSQRQQRRQDSEVRRKSR